jgi:solute carrier family 50 protein (sugar transporter)
MCALVSDASWHPSCLLVSAVYSSVLGCAVFYLFSFSHKLIHTFTAPVQDLRRALQQGSLGALNPFPWAMMTGNCLGWIVYGFYTRDAFVFAANVPGLILSFWLNMGAAKLQYFALRDDIKQHQPVQPVREDWDASPAIMEADDDVLDEFPDGGVVASEHHGSMDSSGGSNGGANLGELLVLVPQEQALLRILLGWAAVITYVGWLSSSTNPAATIGVVVNVNLVFFYGAPLQRVQTVVVERNSESIHVPTMVMNWMNTTFWILYGFAKGDFVIIVPNVLGLSLGLLQGVLCVMFPRRETGLDPLRQEETDSLHSNNNSDDGDVTNGVVSNTTMNTII